MASNQINMPSGFGGLMHYGEEYASKINLKPSHVVAFVISVVLVRIALSIFIK